MTAQCQHTHADGRRCKANARTGRAFCFFHDAESAPARAVAIKAGGIARSRKAAVLDVDRASAQLQSVADVTGLLGESINQVRKGLIDPKIANAIGYFIGRSVEGARAGPNRSEAGGVGSNHQGRCWPGSMTRAEGKVEIR